MANHTAFECARKTLQVLEKSRNVRLSAPEFLDPVSFSQKFPTVEGFLHHLALTLRQKGAVSESQAIFHVRDLCTTDTDLGGLGLLHTPWQDVTSEQLDDIELLVDAWIAALDSAALSPVQPLKQKAPGVRPMTLTEKIFAHHALSGASEDGVRTGDLVRVAVDWVIASEVTWMGMKKSMSAVGQAPRAWRNDRFWLAGDHVVDPRNYGEERVKGFIQGLQSARKELKMTENQGLNYTILHTEFVRERAEPGMLVLGSDSHTCSGGAVSCLAIGLGAGDVIMGLVTGQTWFKIPEALRIDFVGEPAWYIRGKDVVLSILKQLKRNTHAADRIIEFGGPGARALSCDARFAISNMFTGLGAITGVFVPDEVTRNFVNGRKQKMHKTNSLYFQPDEDAVYSARFTIDLSEVESFIAMYPSPDDVHPIPGKVGMRFDGCFIGACTTTEEDLVLAALVLQVGMKRGLPIAEGRGVLPIDKDTVKSASVSSTIPLMEVQSQVYRMGNFVDTDAIIPAAFCTSGTDEELGSHCFEFLQPDLRESVKAGTRIVIRKKAFSCGITATSRTLS